MGSTDFCGSSVETKIGKRVEDVDLVEIRVVEMEVLYNV